MYQGSPCKNMYPNEYFPHGITNGANWYNVPGEAKMERDPGMIRTVLHDCLCLQGTGLVGPEGQCKMPCGKGICLQLGRCWILMFQNLIHTCAQGRETALS